MAIKRRNVLAGGAALWVGGPRSCGPRRRPQGRQPRLRDAWRAQVPGRRQALDYVNPDAPKGGLVRMAGRGTFDSLNPFILKGMPAGAVGQIWETLCWRRPRRGRPPPTA